MEVTKNLRHSLSCGNSSLRSSDSPQFNAHSSFFFNVTFMRRAVCLAWVITR